MSELLIPNELQEFKYAFHGHPRAIQAVIEYCLNNPAVDVRQSFGLDETVPKLDKLG